MRTTNTIGTRRRGWMTGIAAVIIAGTGLLAASPATASQGTGTGGCGPRTPIADIPGIDGRYGIDGVVDALKVAMAQDRIDRAWLYR